MNKLLLLLAVIVTVKASGQVYYPGRSQAAAERDIAKLESLLRRQHDNVWLDDFTEDDGESVGQAQIALDPNGILGIFNQKDSASEQKLERFVAELFGEEKTKRDMLKLEAAQNHLQSALNKILNFDFSTGNQQNFENIQDMLMLPLISTERVSTESLKTPDASVDDLISQIFPTTKAPQPIRGNLQVMDRMEMEPTTQKPLKSIDSILDELFTPTQSPNLEETANIGDTQEYVQKIFEPYEPGFTPKWKTGSHGLFGPDNADTRSFSTRTSYLSEPGTQVKPEVSDDLERPAVGDILQELFGATESSPSQLLETSTSSVDQVSPTESATQTSVDAVDSGLSIYDLMKVSSPCGSEDGNQMEGHSEQNLHVRRSAKYEKLYQKLKGSSNWIARKWS